MINENCQFPRTARTEVPGRRLLEPERLLGARSTLALMLNGTQETLGMGSLGKDRTKNRGRRSFICLGAAVPLAAWAQRVPATGLKRIGFLNGDVPALTESFNTELRRLGYIEGKN